MRILKACVIAFSLYSKIPMPQFAWKDEDMRYVLCFFPWIGAIIGALVYLWRLVCDRFAVGGVCGALIGVAIPLLVTGGFHADGFMDTADAFHSYRSREKKLEILKDPHIGAFSVITFAAYGLFYVAAFSEIKEKKLLLLVCAGFFLARCLSGIAVVSFPTAKREGLLYLFADKAQKRIVRGSLYLQGTACAVFMLVTSFCDGAIILAAALLAFAYYYFRCKKELGGITGDTAGYFVLICELGMMIAAAVLGHIYWNPTS